jgi:hypothetical protein
MLRKLSNKKLRLTSWRPPARSEAQPARDSWHEEAEPRPARGFLLISLTWLARAAGPAGSEWASEWAAADSEAAADSDAIGDGLGDFLHLVVRQSHPCIVVRLEIGTNTRKKRLAARHQAGSTMAAPVSVIGHKKLSLTASYKRVRANMGPRQYACPRCDRGHPFPRGPTQTDCRDHGCCSATATLELYTRWRR